MGKHIKIVVVGLLVVGWIMASAGPATAVGFWWEGTVTKAPWVEEDRQLIGVNKITFSVMPTTTYYERSDDSDGISQQKPIEFRSIRFGQKVLIRIQGHRIHQIIVLP